MIWYLDSAGDYVQAGYDSASSLVDEFGQFLYTEGSEVYNEFGEWVGTLYGDASSGLATTRDAIIEAGSSIGEKAVISSAVVVGVVALVGLFLVYKVVK